MYYLPISGLIRLVGSLEPVAFVELAGRLGPEPESPEPLGSVGESTEFREPQAKTRSQKIDGMN